MPPSPNLVHKDDWGAVTSISAHYGPLPSVHAHYSPSSCPSLKRDADDKLKSTTSLNINGLLEKPVAHRVHLHCAPMHIIVTDTAAGRIPSSSRNVDGWFHSIGRTRTVGIDTGNFDPIHRHERNIALTNASSPDTKKQHRSKIGLLLVSPTGSAISTGTLVTVLTFEKRS